MARGVIALAVTRPADITDVVKNLPLKDLHALASAIFKASTLDERARRN